MAHIRHIVMWKFRNDCELSRAEVTEKMKLDLESLKGKIPGLLSIEVGINVKESEKAFDAVLVSEFDSMESLDNYKKHPLHVPIREFCKAHRSERVFVDYSVD